MSLNIGAFNIDYASTSDDELWIDVMGASVCIQINGEGVITSIYPAWVADESIASCWATWNELKEDE